MKCVCMSVCFCVFLCVFVAFLQGQVSFQAFMLRLIPDAKTCQNSCLSSAWCLLSLVYDCWLFQGGGCRGRRTPCSLLVLASRARSSSSGTACFCVCLRWLGSAGPTRLWLSPPTCVCVCVCVVVGVTPSSVRRKENKNTSRRTRAAEHED